MGVPTFFLSIIKNKFYKNVHSGVKNGNLDCDYFFLDYNGIVYKAYARIIKDIEGKNLSFKVPITCPYERYLEHIETSLGSETPLAY